LRRLAPDTLRGLGELPGLLLLLLLLLLLKLMPCQPGI
jgi:hypothetical protein